MLKRHIPQIPIVLIYQYFYSHLPAKPIYQHSITNKKISNIYLCYQYDNDISIFTKALISASVITSSYRSPTYILNRDLWL